MTPNVEIGFGASLRSSLGDQGTAEVLREVARHVDGMAIDLHLPAPNVQLRDIRGSNAQVEIIINGVRCRVPAVRERGAAPAHSSRALASRIAQIIHVNRELLVDARVAESIRASRSSEQSGLYLPGLSRTAFLDYLRLLIRGCFRLDKGDVLNDPMRPPLPRWTAEACYEQAAGPISGLQCMLWQPPDAKLADEIDGEPIERFFELEQESLFYELGVRFPRVKLGEDETLAEEELCVQINDLRLPRGRGLGDQEFLVSATPERLRPLNIRGRAAANPATGAKAAIVKGGPKLANKARDAGLMAWGRGGYVVLACSGELRRHAAAYVTIESIQHDLDLLRPWYRDVIASAERRFGVSAIAQVFRGLGEEGISIRNLNGVLEAMQAVKSTVDVDFGKYIVFHPYTTVLCPAVFGERIEDVEPAGYAECVRSQFKEYISHKYARGQKTLIVYLLDPGIESRVARSDPLTDEEKLAIHNAVEEKIGALTSWDQTPVILTSIEVRKRLRRLIEVEFPDIAVLSYQELSPNLNVQPIAHITDLVNFSSTNG